MIYAIFILDSSGMPVHTWKYHKAPKTLFKGKDETLVAGLISALLNFGQETFAAPQRIDFNEYALTFFTFKLGDNSYWIIAVSDAVDSRYATMKFLEVLSIKTSQILEKASIEQGLFLDFEGIGERINETIEKTLKKFIRFAPMIRSRPLNSLIVFLPISIAISYIINAFLPTALGDILTAFELLGTLLLLATQIVLAGAIIGFLSANGKVGFINAFFSYVAYYLIILIGLISQGLTESLVIALVIWIFFISPLVGIVGGVIGYFEDIRTLKVL